MGKDLVVKGCRLMVWLFVCPLMGVRPTLASPGDADVNVVVDMTDAGRKIPLPSLAHPAFYVPLVVGFRQEGAPIAGEKPPPPAGETIRGFAKALAQQGYRVVGVNTDKPTLLLVFCWGSWNPEKDTLPVEVPTPDSGAGVAGIDRQQLTVTNNAADMASLVVGNTVKVIPHMPSFMTNVDEEALMSDVRENRYFAVVTAFDWAEAQQHKRVMLWTAKMSVRSTGAWLADVLPALITSGGPFFGRETQQRQVVTVPIVPDGKVKLGELQSKGFVDEKASAEAKPEPEKNGGERK